MDTSKMCLLFRSLLIFLCLLIVLPIRSVLHNSVCFFRGAFDVLSLVTTVFSLLPLDGAVRSCVLFFK